MTHRYFLILTFKYYSKVADQRFPAKLSAEDVADFINQTFVFQILVLHVRELLEQAPLFSGQTGGRYNCNRDEKITTAPAAQHRHPLALQAKHRSGLRAYGNFQRLFTVESFYRNLGAQGSLCESDRDRGVKIASLAFELFVLCYVNNDIEISGRATVGAGLSFTLNAQTRTGLYPRRDFHLHRFFAFNTPDALTITARCGDYAPRTAAHMTRAGHGKEALLIVHLARTAAGLAVL